MCGYPECPGKRLRTYPAAATSASRGSTLPPDGSVLVSNEPLRLARSGERIEICPWHASPQRPNPFVPPARKEMLRLMKKTGSLCPPVRGRHFEISILVVNSKMGNKS